MKKVALKTPFTNLQLELLKVFSYDLSEAELKEIKSILMEYFAKKATTEADRVWEQDKWDEEKINSILDKSERTPYCQ
jgi:hypothetical protein